MATVEDKSQRKAMVPYFLLMSGGIAWSYFVLEKKKTMYEDAAPYLSDEAWSVFTLGAAAIAFTLAAGLSMLNVAKTLYNTKSKTENNQKTGLSFSQMMYCLSLMAIFAWAVLSMKYNVEDGFSDDFSEKMIDKLAYHAGVLHGALAMLALYVTRLIFVQAAPSSSKEGGKKKDAKDAEAPWFNSKMQAALLLLLAMGSIVALVFCLRKELHDEAGAYLPSDSDAMAVLAAALAWLSYFIACVALIKMAKQEDKELKLTINTGLLLEVILLTVCAWLLVDHNLNLPADHAHAPYGAGVFQGAAAVLTTCIFSKHYYDQHQQAKHPSSSPSDRSRGGNAY
jgi:hypothetical protein